MKYGKSLFVGFICLGALSSCSFLTKKIAGLKPQPARHRPYFSPVWIKNHDPLYDTGNLPIGLQGPLIHEGLVYAGHGSGEMRAYQLSDGRLIWKRRDHGAYHSSPIIYGDDLIYGTVEGRIYARNHRSGELIWNVDLDAAVESEGTLYKGRLFYQARNHKVFCLDAKTGKVLWAYKRSVPFLTTLQRASRPLIYGNKLYVGFADGIVGAFSIDDGVLIWEQKIVSGSKFVDVDMDPFIFNGHLILGSLTGPLTVLNPKTGAILRKLNYHVTRQPISWKKRLILGTSDGEIVILGKDYRLLSRRSLGDQGISSMVLWKQGLVVSTVGGELFFLGPEDLELKERYHLGHKSSAVFGKIKVKEGKLAVYSSRNRLYLFK